jgi:nucleotide-binding universal stress UspA family protein
MTSGYNNLVADLLFKVSLFIIRIVVSQGGISMIKQLLVGLDGTEFSDGAIKFACNLAKIHNAKVLGVAVAATSEIEEAYHTPRPLGAGSADSDLHEKSLAEARDFADKARKRFVKLVKDTGISYEDKLIEGYPSSVLLKAASLCDVMVLGRKTKYTCGLPDEQFCDASEEVLEKSVRPLVLVPPEPGDDIKNVMIAIDLQRLTDRVLYNYIHLNPYPKAKIHLVHAAPSPDKAPEIPKEIVDYFAVHNLDVKPIVLTGEHTGQAIVNYAKTEEIDLAVLGVHSMSKIWQVLIGSTGRYIIEKLKIPVYTQT